MDFQTHYYLQLKGLHRLLLPLVQHRKRPVPERDLAEMQIARRYLFPTIKHNQLSGGEACRLLDYYLQKMDHKQDLEVLERAFVPQQR